MMNVLLPAERDQGHHPGCGDHAAIAAATANRRHREAGSNTPALANLQSCLHAAMPHCCTYDTFERFIMCRHCILMTGLCQPCVVHDFVLPQNHHRRGRAVT